MREMKESGVEWIGKIPKEWHITQTRRLFRNEKNIVGDAADEYERLALTLKGVIKRSKNDSEGLQPEKFEGYQILRQNELVFKMIDLENVNTSRVGLSPYTGLVSPAYIVLKNDSDDNRYEYYWFMSMYYNEVFNHLGGDGVRSALNVKDMLSLPIPNISKIQKKMLADYLDAKCSKIDEIIEKQQAIIEKLKEYKLSIITKAVTKGLNPDVEMKDSGNTWFGYIPAHWDCVISRFVFEKVSDINHFMPESVDSGYPYLMIGDLKEHVSDIDFENCKKISKKDFDCLKQKIKSQKGDVIFARYATIGTVCYVDIDIDFLVSYACVTVRPNKELYGEYLYYYFKSCAFRENVKQFINSNTQENVGIEALCKTKITIPPYKEQKMIVNYLNEKSKNIDISIEKKRNIVEKLQEYKKSLIYEVVTGKKEV